MPEKKISQIEFVRSYFIQRPLEVISHAKAKAEIESAYFTIMGIRLEDSDRAIRKLFGEGFLQKIAKGQYMYDPASAGKKTFEEFSASEKKAIFERDGYKCVVCGLGRENGLELQVDHIKPRANGGQGTIENGQTLCAPHNFLKKNLNQTEASKRSFIRLLELLASAEEGEEKSKMENFLREVLAVYDKFGVDSHVIWND